MFIIKEANSQDQSTRKDKQSTWEGISRLQIGGKSTRKAAFQESCVFQESVSRLGDRVSRLGRLRLRKTAFQGSCVSRLGTVGSRLREVRVSENRVFRRKDSRLGRLPSRLEMLRFQERCVSKKRVSRLGYGISRLIELRLRIVAAFQGVSRLVMGSSRLMLLQNREQIQMFEGCVCLRT